jgi:hypothetical protein
MRSFFLFIVFAIFFASGFLNCTLYGSAAKIPYFGNYITEKAARDRDIFMLMYITAGSFLPHSKKIADISLSFVRRAHQETFQDTPETLEPIGPYATRKTFDLVAALIRILYWTPPVFLALFIILLLLPKPRNKLKQNGMLGSNFQK